MIKSLYIRMICTFIGAVLVSLVLSFIATDRIYSAQLRTVVQNSLIANGKTIIQSYEQSYPDNLDALMKGITALPIYDIRLFDSAGKPLHETGTFSNPQFEVDAEQIRTVLAGGVYQSNRRHGYEQLVVGLPFQINGQPFALFIRPEFNEIAKKLAGWFRIQLLIVLFFGSLFIMVSAGYIVRPLRRLTRATRTMAKGDFTVRLNSKRKDEIGELTSSFNQMAHELGMLEKMRQQFVSDVSHEIQSPLTSIKGFTQALKHKKLGEADRMRVLDIIEEESGRLSRMSEDLLQLSSLEYGRVRLNIGRYRLDEQIRNVVVACEPQWSGKNLQIELDLTDAAIAADEGKLSQLWMNLLGNSIKFTEERGSIHITLRNHADKIAVSVTDSGQGIPEEEISDIFKPFYKVDKSRERRIAGNGIGLSIVKRIVDLHGGEIQVSSRVGEGTTFTVLLPQSMDHSRNL